jgi:hypothetical protein
MTALHRLPAKLSAVDFLGRSKRRFFTAGLAFALAAALFPVGSKAADLSQKIAYKTLQAPNACLPDAVGFRNALEVYQRMRQASSWSRVLMVQSRTRSGTEQSHAYCVFTLEGKLWAYDQVAGCRRVWVALEEKADAMKVGRVLMPGNFDRGLWVDQSF